LIPEYTKSLQTQVSQGLEGFFGLGRECGGYSISCASHEMCSRLVPFK